MNILVTRTDRLGDVLLATPVLKKIRQLFPQARITFLVQKAWFEILQFPASEQITLMEYKRSDDHSSAHENELVSLLRAGKFNAAIVLRDEAIVSRAVKRAKIPIRIGPYSTLRSFLYFNRGVFQRRSQCFMHEAEYNLELVEKLNGFKPIRSAPAFDAENLPRSWIHYSRGVEEVSQWLSERGLQPGKYICLHPGSSGSARYVKRELLSKLANTLLKEHSIPVVLTGSAVEAPLLEQVAQEAGIPVENIFGGKYGTRPLNELAELYRLSMGMVAHGTGPLHLAAAVNVPVFAIFPPLYVLSERRWGPLTTKRTVWVPPEVNCPETYVCRGPRCEFFDCMDRFKVEDAVKRILQWGRT